MPDYTTYQKGILHKKAYCKVYYTNLHFVFGSDLPSLAKKYLELGGTNPEAFNSGAAGLCSAFVKDGQLHVIMSLPGTASTATMAHEATHMVNFVFQERGIKLDADNDEAQAYYMSFIVDLAVEALLEYKKKQPKNK